MNIYQRLDTFQMPPDFRGRPGWYVQLWWIVQATLFRLVAAVHVRVAAVAAAALRG